MFIKGIGLISGAGVGLMSLQDHAECVFPPLIPDEIIKSYKLPRMMRRADRFSRIGAMAANEAIKDAAMPPGEMENCGIIVVSAIGPHQTTFAFLDDLLDFPEAEVSPTKFSHSVHNAAASYIAILCGLNGMSLTVTGFDNPWFNALIMAETVLQQGNCQNIILVGVDENGLLSTLLENIISAQLTECAVGMLVSKQSESKGYCTISALASNLDAELIVTKDRVKLRNGSEAVNGTLPVTMFGNALACIAAAIKVSHDGKHTKGMLL